MGGGKPDRSGVLADRKLDHLTICANEDVEAKAKTTLLEEVELLHHSLPELASEQIDLSVEFAGKRLRAPLIISAMSGGVEAAIELNQALAAVAENSGIALGLGSQRLMLESNTTPSGFLLRDVAPHTVILGNIGAVQASRLSTDAVVQLVESIGADGLAIHLNPAQEMIQEQGDRDFRGCLDGIARLCDEVSFPVIVKETGCGLGPSALQALSSTNVRWVDVAGCGGTSWVGVESLRGSSSRRQLGSDLWNWGIPTAVCTACAVDAGFNTIASGGIRTGLDVARALALGAQMAGIALPFLRAFKAGGEGKVEQEVRQIIEQLTIIMVLTNSPNLAALSKTPKVLGPKLQAWLDSVR